MHTPPRPLITPALIAVNVAVFVLTVVQARSLNDNADSALFDAGALVPNLVGAGDWWRLVTSGFLHIGPIHLALNMFALWIIGRDVETALGRGRFLGVYALALLGGSAAVMFFGTASEGTAGASGAVFGLMGALAVLLRRMRIPAGQVFVVIAVNVFISFTIPGISWQGHLGGLVTGAVTAAALIPRRGSAPRSPAVAFGAVGAVVLALLALSVARL
ncbi:rhomboid family intramembrane serine protease [Pseudonocardia phyllosphaerae]|uniref:rhomboid family intramembrane serine protease n=1 Tax=Pseudonocardia phyllosphaerae TaxID=3390502 RepID=UPI0039789283